jgi:hypothetical protein
VQKRSYVRTLIGSSDLDVTRGMPDGTAVNISPFLGAPPRNQRWHQCVGATCDLRPQEQNRSGSDRDNLLSQQRAASILVFGLGFQQESPRLFIAGE